MSNNTSIADEILKLKRLADDGIITVEDFEKQKYHLLNDFKPYINIGENIEFGNWRGRPIVWRVLEIKENKALVISDDILCVRQFDSIKYPKERITWENSDLRAWLNHVFYKSAFSDREQRKIAYSKISNCYKLPCCQAQEDIETDDQLFLLSIEEVITFLGGEIKTAHYTHDNHVAMFNLTKEELDYIEQIAMLDSRYENNENSYGETMRQSVLYPYEQRRFGRQRWSWWLRTPGNAHDFFSYVFLFGDIHYNGLVYMIGTNYYCSGGVRPAMWLHL